MRRRLRAALACVLLAVAAGAAAAAEGPTRIVSLAPHLTELLYAAGAGPRLVGTSEWSDHPAAARTLPRIGDALRLDFERILALAPDLVVAWESGTPVANIRRLESLGLRVVSVRVETLEDIPRAIEQLGDIAGTGAEARRAAGALRSGLEELTLEFAGRRPVDVFVQIDEQPLFTVTGRHLISDLLALCGGRNVFADLPGVAPAVDLEAVIVRNPQVILVTSVRGDPQAQWARWRGIEAVRTGNVIKVPPDEVTRATPRALAGARILCEQLDQARARLAARSQ
jgi:iron complex transport system substrate-binding protein